MKTFIATFHSNPDMSTWPDMDMYIHAPGIEMAAQIAGKYLGNRFNSMFSSVEVFESHDEDSPPEEIIRMELWESRNVHRIELAS